MAAAYSIPDPAITELVDAPPTPTLSVDPTRSYALQLEPLGMPSIEERALPELKLGGMRFSPDLLFPTRMDSNGGRMGTAPLLLELPAPGSDAAPAGLAFVGLPAGHALSFVTWAPTGGKLAFMVVFRGGPVLAARFKFTQVCFSSDCWDFANEFVEASHSGNARGGGGMCVVRGG